MQLVIVESPAKAKTIEKFLGKDFKVSSSIGHIRNLSKKGKDKLGIDIENDFKPDYEIDPDKKKIIRELKKQVKQATRVWLATDEDREGEAIAWHLYESLNLAKKDTQRIVFNEITKSAIEKAINNPRFIDLNLVQAQQTRQILDRIVGFKLSPVLWRKISGAKSAGRVQSPTMKLVVDREREIRDFKPVQKLDIQLELKNKNNQSAIFKHQSSFDGDDKSSELLQSLISDEFEVKSVQSKPTIKRPRAPFTTSTLQQEASIKLGYSVKRTMALAQDLYRKGYISYMRTDSFSLSEQALEAAKEIIESRFSKEDSALTRYKTKSKNAQEAHEAIRPTDLTQMSATDVNDDANRLYQIIWQRTIASQMKPARLKKLKVMVLAKNTNISLAASAESVEYPGFLKVYQSDFTSQNPQFLDFKVAEALFLKNLKANQVFSKPKARYSEASLVKKLETLGIGRPSTYATMISTVQDRDYVVKGSNIQTKSSYSSWQIVAGKLDYQKKQQVSQGDKSKLYPTDIAYILSDFLDNHFSTVINYDFTAKLEAEFDKIASGNKLWLSTLRSFYSDFKNDIEIASHVDRKEVNQEKVLGIDPKTNKTVSVRMGRYGPFAQLTGDDEEEKPIFASLRGNLSLQTITLADALELFKLPRIIGNRENGAEIKANYGRFGPYIQYQNKFVSLGKIDPLEIDLTTALDLIKAKEKKDAEMTIKTFDSSEIKILNGRFGPYISNGKKRGKGQINVTIAKVFKDIKPADLTLDQCQKVIEEKRKNPFNRKNRKRKGTIKRSK